MGLSIKKIKRIFNPKGNIMKVYLDDERKPSKGWILVTRPCDAISLLETGLVAEISLDHDLGEGNGDGYDVLLWIEREMIYNGRKPPLIHVHTANPPARERMIRAVESINRFMVKNTDRILSDGF